MDNESLSFGCPEPIYYVHPDNVFFLDETRDDTHGKDDGNQGGQRKIITIGKIPKEPVRVKDSHYTITPITDAMGAQRFIMVIFAAIKVSPGWSLGIDIFAEWDPDNKFKMGPDKHHPGLSLISAVDREVIFDIVCCQCKGINDVRHSDANILTNGQGGDHPMRC